MDVARGSHVNESELFLKIAQKLPTKRLKLQGSKSDVIYNLALQITTYILIIFNLKSSIFKIKNLTPSVSSLFKRTNDARFIYSAFELTNENCMCFKKRQNKQQYVYIPCFQLNLLKHFIFFCLINDFYNYLLLK